MEETKDEDKPDNDVAGTLEKGAVKRPAGAQSTLVMFVVDISGSMNITTEVPALQGKPLFVHVRRLSVCFSRVDFSHGAKWGRGQAHITSGMPEGSHKSTHGPSCSD